MRIFALAALFGGALIAQSVQTVPVPIYKPEPAYTEEARAAKIQGSVKLQVTIDAEGVPQEIHVVGSLDPGLDLQAIEAVGKWRFKPAMTEDKPVAFQATIEVTFKLL